MPQRRPHLKPLRRGDTAAPLPPLTHPSRRDGRPRRPCRPRLSFARRGRRPPRKPYRSRHTPEAPTKADVHQESPRQGRLALQGIWGTRTPPPTGAFQYSASILPLVNVGDSSHEEILVHAKGRVEGQADDASVFANVLLGQSHAKGSHAFAKIGLEAG